MFFELFNRPIIKISISVLDNTISFDKTVNPSSANGFIFESKNSTSMKLLIGEETLICTMIFEDHKTLDFVTFFEFSSEIVSILILNLCLTL